MDIRVVFASNLKHYRQARGLTQAALAAAMDVDRAHVSAMERGQQNVTLQTLQRVAAQRNRKHPPRAAVRLLDGTVTIASSREASVALG